MVAGLKALRSICAGAPAFHRRSVLTRSVPWPGDDVVEARGSTASAVFHSAHSPWCSAVPPEAHREVGARTREFPGRAVDQPGIRVFDLGAVDDRLGEHAVFVAHAVTPGRQPQRRHRVEEAGGEPAGGRRCRARHPVRIR